MQGILLLKDKNSLINTVKELVDVKRKLFAELSVDSQFKLINDTYPLVFKRNNEKVFQCMITKSGDV